MVEEANIKRMHVEKLNSDANHQVRVVCFNHLAM